MAVAVAVVASVAAAAFSLRGAPAPPHPVVVVSDATGGLGGVFNPGVILAAGVNATSVVLGGIGVYTKDPEFTLPVLALVQPGAGGLRTTNLTSAVNDVFFAGGVYAIGWNGSSWLIAGQAAWGGGNFGSAVSWQGGAFENASAPIYPYFAGGGVFAMGWNGTDWLLGGNSSHGLSLVALHGHTVTDLSALVPTRDTSDWIQSIQWNGHQWLIGGERAFGLLAAGAYTDLLDRSPFATGGVYSAGWNGSAWIAGGGAGHLVVVAGTQVTLVQGLPESFNQAALMVIPTAHGWFVAGKGSVEGTSTGELCFVWTGSPRGQVTDFASLLPDSFGTGEVQGGLRAPPFGPDAVLLVGDGAYDNATGFGVGAVALATLSGA